MNRRGYIRTIEAVIAVLIVLSVIALMAREQNDKSFEVSPVVKSSQDFILETVSTDIPIRFCIIEGHAGDSGQGQSYTGVCNPLEEFTLKDSDLPSGISKKRVEKFTSNGIINCGQALGQLINDAVPHGYFYMCEICDSSVSCLEDSQGIVIPSDGRDIYTKTVFLAVTDKNIREKVLRLYYWKCDKDDTDCIF